VLTTVGSLTARVYRARIWLGLPFGACACALP